MNTLKRLLLSGNNAGAIARQILVVLVMLPSLLVLSEDLLLTFIGVSFYVLLMTFGKKLAPVFDKALEDVDELFGTNEK